MTKCVLTLEFANEQDLLAFFSTRSAGLAGNTMHDDTIKANNLAAHSISGATSSVAMPDDENGPVNTNVPAFDTSGLPWDERIHSKSKGLTEVGIWRKRRGVDANTVASVEAELKMRGAQNNGMYMAPQGPGPQQQTFPGPTPQFQPQQQQYQQPGSQPQQPFVQTFQNQQPFNMQQPGQPQQLDFNTFMQQLGVLMQTKKDGAGNLVVTASYLQSVCQRMSAHLGRQINAVTDALSDPSLIPVAVGIMQQDGVWN